MDKFHIEVDFCSIGFEVKAKNKTEAKKKAKEWISEKINSHINSMYVEKVKS